MWRGGRISDRKRERERERKREKEGREGEKEKENTILGLSFVWFAVCSTKVASNFVLELSYFESASHT